MPQHRPRRIADKNRGFRHKTSARFADKPRTGGIPFIGRCSPYDGKRMENHRPQRLNRVLQRAHQHPVGGPPESVHHSMARLCGRIHLRSGTRHVCQPLRELFPKDQPYAQARRPLQAKIRKRADRSHTCEAGRQQRHNGRTEPDRNPGTVPHNP